ncbi:MAG: cytochrome C oxidase subunit IV family protein [Deltaproteobacteria bacterium]|nr:cytochrome C oxidase subunit IV family protein [Deltaproteobacteria bacterium]MCW5804634.1 cytochrome C oxidase subunit IV family protein [Deltaproteobacteria bacterium]
MSLLALTGLSFGMHFAPLGGGVGTLVALGIATVKVAIVALVFMELRFGTTPIRVVALTCLSFVALLCLGLAADVGFR